MSLSKNNISSLKRALGIFPFASCLRILLETTPNGLKILCSSLRSICSQITGNLFFKKLTAISNFMKYTQLLNASPFGAPCRIIACVFYTFKFFKKIWYNNQAKFLNERFQRVLLNALRYQEETIEKLCF